MALTKDDEMVETFCFCAADPRLGVGIQVGCPWWNGPELDAIGFQDGTELLGELAVPIANDVRRLELGAFLSEDHAHVPSDLGHPDAVGIGRHAGNVNAASVEVHEEQAHSR